MTRIEKRLGLGAGVVAALLVVYVVWGSTYLAIRFAIETLPPFTMAGLRFLLAGAVLYGWARATGAAPPRREHLAPSAGIGALLLLGGNGAVVWAEHHVPSGVAALLVAVEPVWIALLAPAVLGHRRAGWKAVLGLAAGIVGVGVLVVDPRGLDPSTIDPAGAAAIVAGSLSWALGSLWTVKARLPESRAMATALQMFLGGAALLVAGAAAGEWRSFASFDPSTRSLLAFFYLVVFGSILAFSAYAYLLRTARPAVAATYAFVNPVVAVLLGWALAGEPLTWRVAVASAMILGAVAMLIADGDRPVHEATAPLAEREPPVRPASDERAPLPLEDQRIAS
jgi:drug/metabolite transporter (DMT)-like permease